MAKKITGKKFKSIEKKAKNLPSNKVEDLKWEGEELAAIAETKISDDKGTGKPYVIRFFDFGVNLETFKQHKPTAQELFNSHRKGIESLLWRDGLKPVQEVEPRLMFSKNNRYYRFVITCEPSYLVDKPKTLSELLIAK